MAEEKEQKISKYNSGVSALIRLNDLWIDTHKHSRNGYFNSWNLDLDRIWCELAKNFEEKIYQEKKKLFDDFETKLKDSGKINDFKSDAFKEIPNEEIKKRGVHYKILMEKELFLRRLENELGLGTAWEDEDEDDFD